MRRFSAVLLLLSFFGFGFASVSAETVGQKLDRYINRTKKAAGALSGDQDKLSKNPSLSKNAKIDQQVSKKELATKDDDLSLGDDSLGSGSVFWGIGFDLRLAPHLENIQPKNGITSLKITRESFSSDRKSSFVIDFSLLKLSETNHYYDECSIYSKEQQILDIEEKTGKKLKEEDKPNKDKVRCKADEENSVLMLSGGTGINIYAEIRQNIFLFAGINAGLDAVVRSADIRFNPKIYFKSGLKFDITNSVFMTLSAESSDARFLNNTIGLTKYSMLFYYAF